MFGMLADSRPATILKDRAGQVLIRSLAGVLISAAAESHALEVSRRNDQLFLTDESCEKVSKTVDGLRDWLKSSDASRTCTVPSISNRYPCEANITQCVPDHVAKYHGVRPSEAGPNCYNLVLVLKGILPAMRHSPTEEVAYYVASPLCRLVRADERRAAGDIGIVKLSSENKSWEQHAFIYVTEDVAYSKNGYTTKKPYSLQSLSDVFESYDVPDRPECRSNELIKAGVACPMAVSYYRCSPVQEYLANQPPFPAHVAQAHVNLSRFEDCLQSSVFSGFMIPDAAYQGLVDTIGVLKSYVESQTGQAKVTDKERFALGTIQWRIEGIRDQLSYASYSSKRIIELTDLQRAVREATRELNALPRGSRY